MNPVIIIPSRLASVRLPNKPLLDIAGLPMIIQVMKRAMEADIGDVYVACAEEEIKIAVQNAGGKAVLTDPDLPSGTDRIFQALKIIDKDRKHDIIINVQGDLPTIDPSIIKDCLIPFKDENTDITTLAAPITNKEEIDNPNVVKAVVAWENSFNSSPLEGEARMGAAAPKTGKALYFTRASAPYGGDLYHHIGLYAYRRAAIEKFTSLAPSPLELAEKLEQLRALENNMRIDVVKVDTVPLGVDVEADLIKAREILSL